MPFLMQQKCLANETKRSGKLTQMFSELRSTLITSSDNGNANRMPWHVVVEPFSCCCLGREVLHRQQSLGQPRASESTPGAGEQCLELKASILGFWSLQCVCSVSATAAGDAPACPAVLEIKECCVSS